MCGHRGQHHRRTRLDAVSTLPADDLRASDAEREATVATLRAHAGEGRLSPDELEHRVGAAYAAATRRELAALGADLPRHGPVPVRVPGHHQAQLADQVRLYLLVMIVLVAVWALTGAGYFWPVWPALGWGISLLAHAAAGGRVSTPRT